MLSLLTEICQYAINQPSVTTQTQGTQWTRRSLRIGLSRVNDTLDYRQGSSEHFRTYTLNPHNQNSVQIYDGPTEGHVYCVDPEVELRAGGQVVTSSEGRFNVGAGGLKLIGPRYDGKQAEINVSFSSRGPESEPI